MDKRSLVALLLIALVIVGGQLLMPRTPDTLPLADSSRAATPIAVRDSVAVAPPAPTPTVTQRTASPTKPLVVRESSGIPAETLSVTTQGRAIRFTNRGAAPLDV